MFLNMVLKNCSLRDSRLKQITDNNCYKKDIKVPKK